MRATGLWWCCKLYTAVVEIQICRGDGMGSWTTNLQIRGPTSKEIKIFQPLRHRGRHFHLPSNMVHPEISQSSLVDGTMPSAVARVVCTDRRLPNVFTVPSWRPPVYTRCYCVMAPPYGTQTNHSTLNQRARKALALFVWLTDCQLPAHRHTHTHTDTHIHTNKQKAHLVRSSEECTMGSVLEHLGKHRNRAILGRIRLWQVGSSGQLGLGILNGTPAVGAINTRAMCKMITL